MTNNAVQGSLDASYKVSDDVNTVRVSDDSNFVAVGSIDGIIRIYSRTCLNSCPVGYYFNKTSCRMCSSDIIGCSSCYNSTKCYTCDPGYYLDSATYLCVLCDYSLDGC